MSIPAHGIQNVRCYGWCSNKTCGQRRKQMLVAATADLFNVGADVIDVRDYQPKKYASKKWRELMRVIALIDAPGVIFEIWSYLGLWERVH